MHSPSAHTVLFENAALGRQGLECTRFGTGCTSGMVMVPGEAAVNVLLGAVT